MSVTQYGSRPIYTPEKVYLLGDVHNEADKLMSVLDQITPLIGPNDHIVFCGDLVDRGRDAALTVETLVSLTAQFPSQVFFVMGNHDWMLQHYLQTGRQDWMQYLKPTLESFKESWGLSDILPDTVAQALMNKGFKEITSRTIPYYETDRLIATHAPIERATASCYGSMHYQQDYADRANNMSFTYLLDRMRSQIMWDFCDETDMVKEIDKFLVCGHQPGHYKHPRLRADRAFIDTGAGMGPHRPITCLEFPSKKYYQSK